MHAVHLLLAVGGVGSGDGGHEATKSAEIPQKRRGGPGADAFEPGRARQLGTKMLEAADCRRMHWGVMRAFRIIFVWIRANTMID